MNICIVETEQTELQRIKPLWEQLNAIHLEKSVYFKQKYRKFTFENWIIPIRKKVRNGKIKLDLLLDEDTGVELGYCLSSIEDEQGEIESIFIEERIRKLGFGKKLMESALKWFESNAINDIAISVVYANEEALPFYENFGFHIASYSLKRN